MGRVRLQLMDSGAGVWADADLLGAIRLSLQDLNLRAGVEYTVTDLDGATATTLPSNLEGVLSIGSTAYALKSRFVQRSESFELVNQSGDIKALAEMYYSGFEALAAKVFTAEQARTASQKAASSSIFGSWADDWGEVGKWEH